MKKLISFVAAKDSEELFIHLDKSGVDRLILLLESMRDELEANECPHRHLFSGEWGGSDLNPSVVIESDKTVSAIHHIKIYGWTNEWKEKHGFKLADESSKAD